MEETEILWIRYFTLFWRVRPGPLKEQITGFLTFSEPICESEKTEMLRVEVGLEKFDRGEVRVEVLGRWVVSGWILPIKVR